MTRAARPSTERRRRRVAPAPGPIVLAILSTRTTKDAAYDDALVAAAARATVGALGGQSLLRGGA